MISYEVSGSTKRLEAFLSKASPLRIDKELHAGGRRGVDALVAATPVDEGIAQAAWTYEVSYKGGVYYIDWLNRDIEGGFQVVIRLQYGHGTGTGGYVQGRDFINPAIRPIFDEIADNVWKVVTSL